MPPAETKKRLTTDDGRPYLKMKDLSSQVELPKSTILHYLNEGLLPEPIKTDTNMAYYHPDCIERIGMIRKLQTRYRLPLAAIRVLLKKQAAGLDLMLVAEFQDLVFGPSDQPLLDLDGFCRATGLTREQVAAEIAAGVLCPLEDGRFDADDVAVGLIRRGGLGLGLTPADAAYYAHHAKEVVDQEMKLRDRVIAGLPPQQEFALTLEMTRATQTMRAYAFNRAFQQRIMQAQQSAASREKPARKENPQ